MLRQVEDAYGEALFTKPGSLLEVSANDSLHHDTGKFLTSVLPKDLV